MFSTQQCVVTTTNSSSSDFSLQSTHPQHQGLSKHTKKFLMTLNPKHKCHSYFKVSYSQLLLNITMFTSPLLQSFKSLTHQQKTFKETVTLEHHIKYLDREYVAYKETRVLPCLQVSYTLL